MPEAFEGTRPVFAHGDLAPVNVVMDGGAGPGVVVALLDLERARLAHPLFDAAWWSWVVRYHHPSRSPAAGHAFLSERPASRRPRPRRPASRRWRSCSAGGACDDATPPVRYAPRVGSPDRPRPGVGRSIRGRWVRPRPALPAGRALGSATLGSMARAGRVASTEPRITSPNPTDHRSRERFHAGPPRRAGPPPPGSGT